jgi:hypothetical protein
MWFEIFLVGFLYTLGFGLVVALSFDLSIYLGVFNFIAVVAVYVSTIKDIVEMERR